MKRLTQGYRWCWSRKPGCDTRACGQQGPAADMVYAAIMPAGFGVGNHRLFVIDFVTKDLVGEAPPKVVRPASRHLKTKLPGVSEAYCNMLEKEIIKHRLIKRTGEAYERSRSKKDLRNRLNRIDKELGEYMRYAEKKCRKIKSGRIPFSPKVALWIHRLLVYRSILKYHAGTIRNRGNLKRAARRCDISNPLSILIREVYLRIKTCASQCDYFRQNGKYFVGSTYTTVSTQQRRGRTRRQPGRFWTLYRGRKREDSGAE